MTSTFACLPGGRAINVEYSGIAGSPVFLVTSDNPAAAIVPLASVWMSGVWNSNERPLSENISEETPVGEGLIDSLPSEPEAVKVIEIIDNKAAIPRVAYESEVMIDLEGIFRCFSCGHLDWKRFNSISRST